MPVEILLKGIKYTISAWVDDKGDCPVKDYITQLLDSNNSDGQAILNLFDRTVTNGLIHNEQKFRFLKAAGQGLIEFKARGGTRILGFIIDDDKLIVCTHGIPKLSDKRFQREIKKLEEIKELYEFENMKEGSDYLN